MKQVVQFVSHTESISRVMSPNRYTYSPTRGRVLKKLQQWAWRFLFKTRAVAYAFDETTTVESHVVDSGLFLDRLFQQRAELFDYWGREPKSLIIGREDYRELMGSAPRGSFIFAADLGRHTFVGLTVTVVPWMKGMVILP